LPIGAGGGSGTGWVARAANGVGGVGGAAQRSGGGSPCWLLVLAGLAVFVIVVAVCHHSYVIVYRRLRCGWSGLVGGAAEAGGLPGVSLSSESSESALVVVLSLKMGGEWR
jgi:hypothetical protein